MPSRISIRQSETNDKDAIEYLINFEFFTHQHIDWHSFSKWLGHSSFQVATVDNEIIACLSAPNEIKEVAWIRLFACSALYSREKVWNLLLDTIKEALPDSVELICALSLHNWFSELLIQNNFVNRQNIIILEWNQTSLPNFENNPNVIIKPVELSDIPEIVALDRRSFPPIWQVPLNSMMEAFQQAGYFTKAIFNQKIVGYQLCTQSQTSAHLARLAVEPDLQGRKIGSQLIFDMQRHYLSSGINCISVNTQDDNFSSQSLYNKMGFQLIEEKYPVFVLEI
jgi:ribosomal-protein-alanine N-acetyltransferase